MEEPGYPEMRHLVQRRGAPIVHQPIDGDGMLVDGALDDSRIVYVTPATATPAINPPRWPCHEMPG